MPDTKHHSGSVEMFRGSSDINLSQQGREEAHEVAKATKGKFSMIFASPLKRAQETAKIVQDTNPKATIKTVDALEPWFLGHHEGEKVTPERVADLNRRIKEAPDEKIPGKGKKSIGEGESFNDFKDPLIKHVQRLISLFDPSRKILNVTHYRDIQAIKSWLAAGANKDRSIDVDEMTHKGSQKPGALYVLKVPSLNFQEVKHADGNGIYFLRHGATEWNGENGTGPSPNTEPDETSEKR